MDTHEQTRDVTELLRRGEELLAAARQLLAELDRAVIDRVLEPPAAPVAHPEA